MKTIRNILLKTLGFGGYLRFVSFIYLRFVNLGFLKSKYPELFFLKKIIKPGFTCIDIGANVGYYSHFLAKFAGKEGELYSVEPIPLFGKIWKKNVSQNICKKTELLPYALGSENATVNMGTPVVHGVIHHGMTHIVKNGEENIAQTFEVPMRIPDELFANLSKVDFIKCDVEGYEQYVFGNLKNTLLKHKPLVQSELGGEENRKFVINLFEELGYTTCLLRENEALTDASIDEKLHGVNDFYFVAKH
jgi:FkbM family methyltransferase